MILFSDEYIHPPADEGWPLPPMWCCEMDERRGMTSASEELTTGQFSMRYGRYGQNCHKVAIIRKYRIINGDGRDRWRLPFGSWVRKILTVRIKWYPEVSLYCITKYIQHVLYNEALNKYLVDWCNEEIEHVHLQRGQRWNTKYSLIRDIEWILEIRKKH